MEATPCAPSAARRLDLDNLRNAAVLLLIVFHTARLFDGEAWHIKDAGHYWLADTVVRALNQWQMPILFLLAGMAVWHALENRSVVAFLRERVLRLLVPLIAGIFIAVYPQVYVERIAAGAPGRASPIDFAGGPLDFLPQFFSCCYPQANFSYHHLWFIAYLFAYSLALAPLFALARAAPVELALRRAAAWLGSLPRLLLLGVPVIALELWLRPSYPSTHALAGDWANHAHYLYLVAAGWVLARNPGIARMLAGKAAPLGAAAVGLSVLWLAEGGSGWGRGVGMTIRHAGEWLWLLALLGLARRFLEGRVALLTAFTRYAFPFYIAHQAFIVILGWFWISWNDDPLLKYFAVAGLSLAASLAFCRLADTNPLTRFLVALKPSRA